MENYKSREDIQKEIYEMINKTRKYIFLEAFGIAVDIMRYQSNNLDEAIEKIIQEREKLRNELII
jgi:cation transport regulator ChaB